MCIRDRVGDQCNLFLRWNVRHGGESTQSVKSKFSNNVAHQNQLCNADRVWIEGWPLPTEITAGTVRSGNHDMQRPGPHSGSSFCPGAWDACSTHVEPSCERGSEAIVTKVMDLFAEMSRLAAYEPEIG